MYYRVNRHSEFSSLQLSLSGARGWIILSSPPSRYTFRIPRLRYVFGLARYWHLSVHRFHPILQRPKLNVVSDDAAAVLNRGHSVIAEALYPRHLHVPMQFRLYHHRCFGAGRSWVDYSFVTT
jgi:hypothetical protein